MSAILVVATVQSWFLAALVASRRDRRLSDDILVAWLTLMGLHTAARSGYRLGVAVRRSSSNQRVTRVTCPRRPPSSPGNRTKRWPSRATS